MKIGSYYQVPCVRAVRNDHKLTMPETERLFSDWIPVIGPKHNDSDISDYKLDHWHVDWRFTAELLPGAFFALPIDAAEVVRGPELRRKMMRRQMPRYAVSLKAHSDRYDDKPVPWLYELENAFADKKLKTCRTCPHRGIPLRGIRAYDGVVTCPGHGLAWNVKTGELVRRASKEVPREK